MNYRSRSSHVGNDNEFVHFGASDYFDISAGQLFDSLGELFASIATIEKEFFESGEGVVCLGEQGNSTVTVIHISRGHANRIWKSEYINRYVYLHSTFFLAPSYPFSSAVSAFCIVFESPMSILGLNSRPRDARYKSSSIPST